jgi:hypothetical protein
MNREDIEHMWKVASNNPNHDTNWYDPVVVAFAALVASAEREACAKVCEQEWSNAAERDFAEQCAAIIRGREVRGHA